MSLKPLIVLFHGALTGVSVWNSVAEQLQRNGYTTLAPAMPLRGLHADAEYLSSILTQPLKDLLCWLAIRMADR
jgi:hypothetical protein